MKKQNIAILLVFLLFKKVIDTHMCMIYYTNSEYIDYSSLEMETCINEHLQNPSLYVGK